MKNRNKRHRMPRTVALAICAALFSTATLAGPSETVRQEGVGFVTGMVLGAVVGGPPGAVIGAIGGGFSARAYNRGRTLERQQGEIEYLRAQLQQAEVRAAARNRTLRANAVTKVASVSPAALAVRRPRTELETSIEFRTASADLEAHFADQLQLLAAFAAALPGAKVQLSGYADPRGDAPANLKLSSARVAAVRRTLIAEGVQEDAITTEAFGESRPLYAAGDREGNDFERRVLIRIATQEPQS